MVPRGSVLGVDPSRNMIEYAAKNFTATHPNLRFDVADARRLPYRGEFDLLVEGLRILHQSLCRRLRGRHHFLRV